MCDYVIDDSERQLKKLPVEVNHLVLSARGKFSAILRDLQVRGQTEPRENTFADSHRRLAPT